MQTWNKIKRIICQPELTLTIVSYSAELFFSNVRENDSEFIKMPEL